jgi:putative transposase
MVAILSAVVSIFAFRFRGRASLELELVALRHQVTVLRRQRPGRPQLSSLDRLLWGWLYRIWPQVIDAMVLVKPATVVRTEKLDSDVLVMKSPDQGMPHDASNPLNRARDRRILV